MPYHARSVDAHNGTKGLKPHVFADNGRLQMAEAQLVNLVAGGSFDAADFVAKYMGQLSTVGFETARQEIDKVISNVQNQILDNSVTNNGIYVLLCDSVQSMESQLQKLHGVLASLRTLSGELRFLAITDGESTNRVGATNSTALVGGDTTKLIRQPASVVYDFELPELAQLAPVWRMFSEHLDLALAERKLHKHHRLLSAAGTVLDDILKEASKKGDISSTVPLHLWIEQKEAYLEESRRSAILLLESTIMEPGIARTDLQQNVRLLSKISTPLHAATCLLSSHEQSMEHQIQMLRKSVGIGWGDFEFLGAVSQRIFGCIGRAANDLALLFRKTAHELSSAFTVWSLRLTERCVDILVKEVLRPHAIPMGLSATMECLLQVMVYCSCLEDTHRVCLQPHLLRVLWPEIESMIDSHVTSASDRIRAAAMGDVSEMVSTRKCPFQPTAAPPSGAVLISEINFMLEELLSMDAIEVGKNMRNATIAMFNALCDGVERGIRQATQSARGNLPQVLVVNGENIMMSLSFVMETSLPKATASCTQKLGVLCVGRKMEPALHKVASALGVEAVAD